MEEARPLYRSRYPDHDVLARAHEWDEPTRRVVMQRLEGPPPLRVFDEREARALEALADTLVPQDDRPPKERIPLVAELDARLAKGSGPGFRWERLPPEPGLWHELVGALDDEARHDGATGFAALDAGARAALVGRVFDRRGRSERWSAFDLRLLQWHVVGEFAMHYYGHPYAWNEIGFGGPRFPRIYARPLRDNPDEAKEVADATPP